MLLAKPKLFTPKSHPIHSPIPVARNLSYSCAKRVIQILRLPLLMALALVELALVLALLLRILHRERSYSTVAVGQVFLQRAYMGLDPTPTPALPVL